MGSRAVTVRCELEVVHLFDDAMPTGVSVSRTGRIFRCYRKWGDDAGFDLATDKVVRTILFPADVALPTT